ncbi:MAG TPA: hypothetical protein VHK24_02630 [Steroidobacter sp.]|nr:hypothetical protein [Steroidobacter sp.]
MNTFGDQGESGVEGRARELFEESLQRIDARTRSRLTQARHAALEELRRKHPLGASWLWAPAGALACAVVALLIFGRPGVGGGASSAPSLEDLEAVADAESVELLQDVEFYAWLAEQRNQKPKANRS